MTNLPRLPDELRPVLREFLASQPTLVLGTVGVEDGRPQVAALFFASDEAFNLYWISDPGSRHSQNLTDWEDVAATVYAPTWDWSRIQGIQIEGYAEAVNEETERQHALALYEAKFPFVTDKFADLIAESTVYVLRPRWLRWLDNTRHFGYKQEFLLEQSSKD